jgi:hypothetical protein
MFKPWRSVRWLHGTPAPFKMPNDTPEIGAFRKDPLSACDVELGTAAVASVEATCPVVLAASLLGGAAVLVGSVVLTRWALDTTGSKSALPVRVSLEPNAIFAFVLLGTALELSISSVITPRPGRSRAGPRRFLPCVGLLRELPAGLIDHLALCGSAFRWNPALAKCAFPESAPPGGGGP